MFSNVLFALKRFRKDIDGGVAIMFSLAAIPFVGAAGAAVDYSSATGNRTLLQQAADGAALAGGKLAMSNEARARQEAQNVYRAIIGSRLPTNPPIVTINRVTREVKVDASADVATNFLKIINVNSVNVGVTSTAKIGGQLVLKTADLTSKYTGSTAWDYNRIVMYCYDHNRRNDLDRGRTKITQMFDNGGTTFTNRPPECLPNEGLSFYLHNVICERSNPAMWNTTNFGVIRLQNTTDGCADQGKRFHFFVDIRIENGVLIPIVTQNLRILDMRLCNTMSECRFASQGGMVPDGNWRTPVVETRACPAGKFMHIAIEDHPLGYQAQGEEDYADIGFVLPCPELKESTSSEGIVRLVR